jgi:hypothetical protein
VCVLSVLPRCFRGPSGPSGSSFWQERAGAREGPLTFAASEKR